MKDMKEIDYTDNTGEANEGEEADEHMEEGTADQANSRIWRYFRNLIVTTSHRQTLSIDAYIYLLLFHPNRLRNKIQQ